MDSQSLSSRQVYWAQKLSQYNFWMDYCQGKSNIAVNTLSQFPQKSQDEGNNLQAENS